MSYSPVVGRFIERDPLEYVDSMNAYEALLSNPVKYTDPAGTQVQGWTGPGMPPPIPVENRKDKLDRWSKNQKKSLGELLRGQCPTSGNSGTNCCTPEDCARQAQSIADAIVNAIYNQRIKSDQFGGSLGNWTYGYQCGDWQQLTENAAQQAIRDSGGKSCFTVTRVNASTQVWWPQVDLLNGTAGWRSTFHNWTELSVPNGPPIVIDPWPSGGGTINDTSYTGGWTTTSRIPR
ncbi:MAG TPA: RHS repeat-associated core domain-containing protein [Tepidisphaeraceae bacterium]|jgi:hypothetical protein